MSEAYYAKMESERNVAEDAYFAARPQADNIANRTLFRAGFDRGFGRAWTEQVRLSEGKPAEPSK